jgi:hypothetical protein
VSRSGPNIKPPNKNAPVTSAEIEKSLTKVKVAAKTGAVNKNVMASCVFPDGIFGFDILARTFGKENFRR